MGRHPVERHNEEFITLFDRHVASLGDGRGNADKATQQAAELLGVNPHTVTAWRRPEGGKAAIGCPAWRVHMYKLALPPEVSRISDTTRESLLTGLRMLRGSGIMSEDTVKAFDRLARKRRAAG